MVDLTVKSLPSKYERFCEIKCWVIPFSPKKEANISVKYWMLDEYWVCLKYENSTHNAKCIMHRTLTVHIARGIVIESTSPSVSFCRMPSHFIWNILTCMIEFKINKIVCFWCNNILLEWPWMNDQGVQVKIKVKKTRLWQDLRFNRCWVHQNLEGYCTLVETYVLVCTLSSSKWVCTTATRLQSKSLLYIIVIYTGDV